MGRPIRQQLQACITSARGLVPDRPNIPRDEIILRLARLGYTLDSIAQQTYKGDIDALQNSSADDGYAAEFGCETTRSRQLRFLAQHKETCRQVCLKAGVPVDD